MSDPLLFTPGPLTTSETTRRAMLRDWGSRDAAFIAMTARVRARLAAIADAGPGHVAVPIQGSGTFAIEATLGTFVPRDGKLLILVNGEYCRRMATICARIGRAATTLETAEDTPPDLAALDAALAGDPGITHVAVVHCETTSGILNPLADVARVVAARGRRLIVDAMSSFGAIPVHAPGMRWDAVVASSNKCLEGTPGIGFAICREDALAATKGNSPSLAFDLHDQWRGFEANGQWRYTPPTHVLAALDQALVEHEAEGGVAGRGARYRSNCRILTEGLRRLGFTLYLPDALQAPVIVTILTPRDPAFRFATFYERLADRGLLIYPGKLTKIDSFRIGCIGRLGEPEMRTLLTAVEETLAEMGVKERAPLAA
ncbi:MAG: 2-aminoethylphosphonate--pyruvate transaminase [Rhodospirillales bacterium]